MSDYALHVRALGVRLAGGAPIVQDLSLDVGRGEVVGIVGESGSGKTTVALALLGFARPGVVIETGVVQIDGTDVLGRPEEELRGLRGTRISYVPQDPATALNPSLRVGDGVREVLRAHAPGADRDVLVQDALERVGLPGTRAFQRRFPHQLSGGQQQRVAIAIALICRPTVAVLDEPTTGLDVITQARILDEIRRLRDESGIALVYVSHDLAVVAEVADRIMVMYAGRVVESGPAAELISSPRHPYTRGLIASVPDHARPHRLIGIPGVAVGVGDRPPGCAFAPRCPQRRAECEEAVPPLEHSSPSHVVRCFEWRRTPPVEREERTHRAAPSGTPLLKVTGLRAEHRTREGTVVAADDVAFTVAPGECVALVGESGSGKTTIARCVAGLHAPAAGDILLAGARLAPRASQREREERRRLQIVFQNPYESLNPRHSVATTLAWPARRLRGLSRGAAEEEATSMLESVRLAKRIAQRYPSELSGGERQRVAIARALVARPDLLICDEITSALDVSVQAAILDLLAELRARLGLALLFITHDLGVVASVADRVLVLHHGIVCEEGAVGPLLSEPREEYTRALVSAAPSLPAA